MSDFVAAYRVSFSDGGEPEVGVLCEGTAAECERAADLMPALAYKDGRPVASVDTVVLAPRS